MIIKPGDIYKSTALMDDPNFIQTTILIASNDENGSVGFVLNKIFHRTLNELTAYRSLPAIPLYVGGPVDQEHLYVIHTSNHLIPGATHITGDLYFGGVFERVTAGILSGNITTKNIKLLLGYCGWNANELEDEIEEGNWEKVNVHFQIIFE